jgi:hypothetical protein
MRVTVTDTGNSVRGDGRGEYVDTADNAGVNDLNAFALRTFWPNKLSDKPVRSLSVDLNDPVAGGGGVPMGVFTDQRAVIASYWRVDSSNFVFAPQDIPLGTTVASERTQIWITNPVDGKRYVVHFGPWSNRCEPFGEVPTDGSTQVQITRTGPHAYIFNAPKGSIATLADVADQSTPIRKGLYYVNFYLTAASL